MSSLTKSIVALREARIFLLEAEDLELHIYDFDHTLFASPMPPKDKKIGKWFSNPESLEPPTVPDKPGREWWNSKIVSLAKKSIADPNVYAVMMSGRHERGFRFRIPQLLKQVGLNFDEVILGKGAQPTVVEKQKKIREFLRKFPDVSVVKIWDDRDNHASVYAKLAKSLGREAKGYKVKAFTR